MSGEVATAVYGACCVTGLGIDGVRDVAVLGAMRWACTLSGDRGRETLARFL